MKKILLPLILFALVSCNSRQHKAEALVKHYLDSALDDPSSYQSINFQKLQPVYMSYGDTPKGKAAYDHTVGMVGGSPTYDSVMSVIRKKEANFKRDKIFQWLLQHDYRAKNKLGALERHINIFIFNYDVTTVLKTDTARIHE